MHQQRTKCRKSDRITRIKMDHCKVHRGTAKRKKNFIFKKILVLQSVSEMARDYEITPKNMSVKLLRIRKELKEYLKEEGFEI